MILDLFETEPPDSPKREILSEGTTLLRGSALSVADGLLQELTEIIKTAPFRRMTTPGGFRMTVETTCCGEWGWTIDADGYRYTQIDPEGGRPWPAMPDQYARFARQMAALAGFGDFRPDSCLINRYLAGAKMSLHQDRNERDRTAPIVSVSLGLPATFLLGGNHRSGAVIRIRLQHGDVLVWGGPDRMRFHGIQPVKPGPFGATGNTRINFTFRKAS